MLKEMWTLLLEKKGFFLDLLVEHIEISLLAIVIAIVIGGGAGILISEYQKASKPTLGVINFLYTIPSWDSSYRFQVWEMRRRSLR